MPYHWECTTTVSMELYYEHSCTNEPNFHNDCWPSITHPPKHYLSNSYHDHNYQRARKTQINIPHAKSHRTAPHSTFKHDNRALPIHGLPPEDKTLQNAPEGKPQRDIKIPGLKKLLWVKPTTSGGLPLWDRCQEIAILQSSTKYDNGHNHLISSICGLLPGIRSPKEKTGTQDDALRI